MGDALGMQGTVRHRWNVGHANWVENLEGSILAAQRGKYAKAHPSRSFMARLPERLRTLITSFAISRWPAVAIRTHEGAVRDGVERHSSRIHLLALRVHLLLLAALAVRADEGAVRVGV